MDKELEKKYNEIYNEIEEDSLDSILLLSTKLFTFEEEFKEKTTKLVGLYEKLCELDKERDITDILTLRDKINVIREECCLLNYKIRLIRQKLCIHNFKFKIDNRLKNKLPNPEIRCLQCGKTIDNPTNNSSIVNLGTEFDSSNMYLFSEELYFDLNHYMESIRDLYMPNSSREVLIKEKEKELLNSNVIKLIYKKGTND